MTQRDNWENKHLKDVARYVRQIEAIYRSAVRDIASIGAAISDFNPDKPFSFADCPNTQARIEKLLKSLKNNIQLVVLNGIEVEWTLANNKNNELCNVVFGKYAKKLTAQQERRYYSTNDNARKAFAERKVAGLNLSDRVWRYTDQFKTEIEMGLDLGLRDGLSADEMSRTLRQYLQQPDRLFRRVKDEHGLLHLSKQAAAYHPGQGVYRSSYKNARRLAATETNIAYRTSDYTRWQQLDFVVGIEIKLSNNHTLNGVEFTDICDDLAGKYPKNFKFTGWHPHCRCYAVSILKTPEEMEADNKRIMAGEPLDSESVNKVDDVPDKFKNWLTDNEERIERAKSLPYFIRDNEKYCPQMYITQAAAEGVKEAQSLNEKLVEKPAPIKHQTEKKPATKSAAELKAEEKAMAWLNETDDPVLTSTYYEIKDTLPASVRKDYEKLRGAVLKRYWENSADKNYDIVIPTKEELKKAIKQEAKQTTPNTATKSKAETAKTQPAASTNKEVTVPERSGEFIDYKTQEEGDKALFGISGENWLKLNTKERDALYRYTTDEYRKINSDLRNGKSNSTAKLIHQALEKQTLPDNMILRRGETPEGLARFGIDHNEITKIIDANRGGSLRQQTNKQGKLIKELLTGKEGEEKGFLSTSFAGKEFGGGITLEISVPKGTQAMYTSPFSDYGGIGKRWNGKEHVENIGGTESEILINSGYKLKIKDVEYKKTGFSSYELILKVDLY